MGPGPVWGRAVTENGKEDAIYVPTVETQKSGTLLQFSQRLLDT